MGALGGTEGDEQTTRQASRECPNLHSPWSWLLSSCRRAHRPGPRLVPRMGAVDFANRLGWWKRTWRRSGELGLVQSRLRKLFPGGYLWGRNGCFYAAPCASSPDPPDVSVVSSRGCGTLSLPALSQSLPSWDAELKKLIRWTLVSSLWNRII